MEQGARWEKSKRAKGEEQEARIVGWVGPFGGVYPERSRMDSG
jgi:hypothetical protein